MAFVNDNLINIYYTLIPRRLYARVKKRFYPKNSRTFQDGVSVVVYCYSKCLWGGRGAMVLGKPPVPGSPTI